MPCGPGIHEQKRPEKQLLPKVPRQAEPFCQIQATSRDPPQGYWPPNRSLSAADGAITPQAIAEPKTHSPSLASRNFRAFMTDLLRTSLRDGRCNILFVAKLLSKTSLTPTELCALISNRHPAPMLRACHQFCRQGTRVFRRKPRTFRNNSLPRRC
jgi:hypothetical protein